MRFILKEDESCTEMMELMLKMIDFMLKMLDYAEGLKLPRGLVVGDELVFSGYDDWQLLNSC